MIKDTHHELQRFSWIEVDFMDKEPSFFDLFEIGDVIDEANDQIDLADDYRHELALRLIDQLLQHPLHHHEHWTQRLLKLLLDRLLTQTRGSPLLYLPWEQIGAVFEQFDLVGDVIEVNGDGWLLEEFDAFDSYLVDFVLHQRISCRIGSVAQRRQLEDAILLTRLVQLAGDYLLHAQDFRGKLDL